MKFSVPFLLSPPPGPGSSCCLCVFGFVGAPTVGVCWDFDRLPGECGWKFTRPFLCFSSCVFLWFEGVPYRRCILAFRQTARWMLKEMYSSFPFPSLFFLVLLVLSSCFLWFVGVPTVSVCWVSARSARGRSARTRRRWFWFGPPPLNSIVNNTKTSRSLVENIL